MHKAEDFFVHDHVYALPDPMTGEPTEATFTIASQYSAEFRMASIALGHEIGIDPEDDEATEWTKRRVNLIASVVKDWNEDVWGPHSKENVINLLLKPESGYIVDKLEDVVNDKMLSFRKESPKTD